MAFVNGTTTSSSAKPTSSYHPPNGTYCPVNTQFTPPFLPLPVPADSVVCSVDVIAGNVPILERCCNTTNITYLPFLQEGYDYCWAYCVYRTVTNNDDVMQANQDIQTCFQDAAVAKNLSQDAYLGGLQCVWQPKNTTGAGSRMHAAGGVTSAVVWTLFAGFVLAAGLL